MDGLAQTDSRIHQSSPESVRVKLYENEEGYLQVSYLHKYNMASLHLTFDRSAWTHRKFRKYLVIWDSILADLRGKCYTEVWAFPFEGDEKAQKLIALFGFKEVGRKRGHVLMNRKV